MDATDQTPARRLYDETSQATSRLVTGRYSSSFGSASRLFAPAVRPHIYNIYGLVRAADEIVDTYHGPDAADQLDDLEADVYRCIRSGYSANPLVHAYGLTARRHEIDKALIAPFFASMRSDLAPAVFDQAAYEQYIHGSAEVVGLMCLRVFCAGDHAAYDRLAPGAARLGAAYQKVNFLRDVAADHGQLGRMYFPGLSFDGLDDAAKDVIVADIRADFAVADPAIQQLPPGCRQAVRASYVYYGRLLDKLAATPAVAIKRRRIGLGKPYKLYLFARTAARAGRP